MRSEILLGTPYRETLASFFRRREILNLIGTPYDSGPFLEHRNIRDALNCFLDNVRSEGYSFGRVEGGGLCHTETALHSAVYCLLVPAVQRVVRAALERRGLALLPVMHMIIYDQYCGGMKVRLLQY